MRKLEISQSSYNFAKRIRKFSLATLFSRILGYVRDASVAYYFGGGQITDSFYTAFRISNFFRTVLGEGALSSSFIPVFSKSLKEKSKEEVQKFLNALFTHLFILLVLLTSLGIYFAPIITQWIAPGFVSFPSKFNMTVSLTRWTFPFFLFISLAALVSAILNTLKHFFLPALAPSMLSVAEISYLILILPLTIYYLPHLSLESQIIGLSIAVVLGGVGHFLIQLPLLYKENFSLKFNFHLKHPDVMRVRKLMLPSLIGLSADKLSAFVNSICATLLVEGSVTALYNSNRLMQLPLALFGVAIASVSLPMLSDHTAENNYKKLSATVNESLRTVIFVVLPASLGLAVLARPIVSLLFEHGKFTALSTSLTVQALQGYALGLVAYSAIKILANTFYAFQEPKIPVKIAISCVTLNICLNIILMEPLGVGGLALATSISSWVNVIWLYLLLQARLKKVGEVLENSGSRKLSDTLLKTFVCSGIMLIYLYLIYFLEPWIGIGGLVVLGVAGGSLLYLICAKSLKMEEQKLISIMIGQQANPSDLDE